LYQSAAAGADGTASISEICGPAVIPALRTVLSTVMPSHELAFAVARLTCPPSGGVKQVPSQLGRPRKRDQVATGQYVGLDA
jgi:hypothetical protein